MDDSGFGEITVEICTRTVHTVPLSKLREWRDCKRRQPAGDVAAKRIRDKTANWRLRCFLPVSGLPTIRSKLGAALRTICRYTAS